MTTEEKLQLIDNLRSGFARGVADIVKDEPGIVGNIVVTVTFYSIDKDAPLWEAAKSLDWNYRESGGTAWFVSEDNLGDTTLFL